MQVADTVISGEHGGRVISQKYLQYEATFVVNSAEFNTVGFIDTEAKEAR